MTNPIIISRLFTEYIVFGALLNTPKLVYSVNRWKVIVRLIASRALDKVGPSICVFSASIHTIMHDTGLIVYSRMAVRTVPVIIVKMDGMAVRR